MIVKESEMAKEELLKVREKVDRSLREMEQVHGWVERDPEHGRQRVARQAEQRERVEAVYNEWEKRFDNNLRLRLVWNSQDQTACPQCNNQWGDVGGDVWYRWEF